MNNMASVFIFFENIRYLRKKHRLTQKQMAEILGIGIKSLSLIERGILPPRLSGAVLLRAEEYFKIPLKDMFLHLED